MADDQAFLLLVEEDVVAMRPALRAGRTKMRRCSPNDLAVA